jgi:peptidoglycan-associated lipoprotein
MRTRRGFTGSLVLVAFVALSLGACAKKTPPVARPIPPPPPPTATAQPAPVVVPEEVKPAPVLPPAPIKEDKVAAGSLDDINRSSPLKPVFFDYDSAEVTADGQKVLDANAEVLKKNQSWVVTIEGHCDERGTAEYNLALGERRAVAAKAYLVSLGVAADRIDTLSYGKEFPFDPGHDEQAWAKNRRGHFVVTRK